MKQLFICVMLGTLPVTAQTVEIDVSTGEDIGQKITLVANSNICTNGCNLSVPPGVYKMTTTAQLPNRSNMRLISAGATLEGNPSLRVMVSMQGNNDEIKGFDFQTNGSNYAIIATAGRKQLIAGNHFSGTAGVYIAVSSSPGGFIATDNRFDGGAGCAFQGDITVFLSTDFTITKNKIENTCGFAIQTAASGHGTVSYNSILQTTFSSSLTADGLHRSFVFNWQKSPKVQRVWVQKNNLADNTPAVSYSDSTHTTVTYSTPPPKGSIITALGWTSLEDIQVNSQSWDITVLRNIVDGSGDAGIDIVSDFHGTAVGSKQSETKSNAYRIAGANKGLTTPVAVLDGRVLTAGEATVTKDGTDLNVILASQAQSGASLAIWDFVLDFAKSAASDFPGQVTVSGNTVRNIAAACIAPEIAAKSVSIEENTLQDCGIGVSTDAYSSGIFTGGASPLVIRHNTIRNSRPIARAGISIQNIANDTGSKEKLIIIQGNSCVGVFSSGCVFIPTLEGYRQQSIDIQDGQDIPYPQQPHFDSPFTNTPANTDRIQYAQTGGGAQYDTTIKISGAASAKIPPGTSLQIYAKDTAFFDRSIAKVSFWAKRTGTTGSPRVMLVTNLSKKTYFQVIPIINAEWKEFSFYTSFAGLDADLLRLDCEANGGQLNIQNVQFYKRAIPK